MADNSNSMSTSDSFAYNVLVSDIKSTIVSNYITGEASNMPLVRLEFKLISSSGEALSTNANIESMSYFLSANIDGSYQPPTEDSVWTEINSSEWTASNVDDKNVLMGWQNRNRDYLQIGRTSDQQTSLNYIIIKIKKFDELNNIEDSQFYVKLKLKETSDTEDFSDTIADASGNTNIIFKTVNDSGEDAGIRTVNPYIGELYEDIKYTNSSSFTIKIKNYDGFAQYFAYDVNGGTMSNWEVIPENSLHPEYKEITINLGSESQDGKYRVRVTARDSYFNYYDFSQTGSIISFDIEKTSELPYDCDLNIYGKDGNSRYAGIKIESDGSFTPDRSVNIVFFGNSKFPLYCRIYSNDNEVLIPKITTSESEDGTLSAYVSDIDEELIKMEELDSSNSNCDSGEFLYKNTYTEDKTRPINEVKCYLVGPDYDTSSDRSVTIVFRDIAGNETIITKTIKLNNRIFVCEKKNLREPSSDYMHIVMKKNTYDAYDTIPESATGQEDSYKRMWEDIYFPEKHSPKMNGKNIDIEWARSAYKQYVSSGRHDYQDNENYDIISMELDSESVYQPVYDSEGRVSTIWNYSKTYDPYVSRNRSDMWFRVIDNTGEGDINLSFEYFDMMSSPGDMANSTAGGYKGDVVMIYNADNENCLTQIQNADGTITYPVDGVNTVLMELLAVYSGTPGSVYDWLSGESVKSNDTTGAFDVTFQCSRICIIVCTDSSKEKSGFKIKAGKKIGLIYSNYDVDETNGELWYHGESDNWGSTDGGIRMFYDYYDSSVSYDYDRGFVILNVNDIPDDAIMTCDYSYYKNKRDYNEEDNAWLKGDSDENNNSAENYRLYVASDDDFYDYLVPTVYVTPIGGTIDKSGTVYRPGDNISGKFTDSYWVVDKDRGLIQINRYNDENPDKYVPFNENGYPMRITMDYTHHTFYRLSNDGYGNVSFEDKVIVADSTPVYPDATWADIRIINEGDAILESGKLIFKCRGEVEGDSEEVKKPLDVNRPWDVQEGKKAVTWDRCRVYISYTFNENYFQFTPSISNLRFTYNAAGGNDASLVVSSVENYLAPKEALYGRIVWNLAGDTGGSLNNVNYPTDGLTVGRKSWSMEVSGKYYVVND